MLMLPDYRVRQRDFLLQISRAITARLDLQEVLRIVLQASVAMLGSEVGLIALRDTEDGEYRIRAATGGIERDKFPQLTEYLRELVSSAIEQPDREFFDFKLNQMAVAIDRRLRQSIALPLVIGDDPVGVLIIFRAQRGMATVDDVHVLQSFADQAAIAVYNAQLYESADHERLRLAAILEHSADGVMILDPDLNIMIFNHALERMTAWRAEDAMGRYHDEIITWAQIVHGDLNAAIANGWPLSMQARSPSETLYVEGDLQRLDGLTLSIGITYAPLFSESGKLVSIIANVRDITHFRQAQEMQNVFISGISHELKTPVALIKGYAGTLRREDANWDPETIRESAAVIEDEADRLTRLINNLLAASRIQVEGLALEMMDTHLDQIASEAVERFRTQSDLHKFKLKFPADFPVIQGDATRLRQVIDNLLSNAIKYSPQPGVIEVGGWAANGTVTVYTRDNGVGLTEANREQIFERFYRVDGALSRRTQGTGLGLYLARAIIEAHQGRIWVESKPGQGSTFYFTLPQ